MSTKQQSTTVEIYGANYNVRGEGDPAYLMELARMVDSKMREIASQVSAVDPARIAILTALNLADELVRCRRKQETTAEVWMERTEELADRLGKSLAEPAKRTQI